MADDPIELCLDGRISAPVALARLLLSGAPSAQIEERLNRLDGVAPAAAALRDLACRHHAALSELADLVMRQGIDHAPSGMAPDQAVRGIARLFDDAVGAAPEASVAFYSLGDRELLQQATTELLDWLAAERLIGPAFDVLDLGCGIGRVAAALAPRCRRVLGLDVSPRMVAAARARHGDCAGVRFEVTPGTHLAQPAQSFDLVLAVDVFPYLVQAGGRVAERHVADAATILRPGGAMAIGNVSYRGEPGRDAADVEAWAARGGLVVDVAGARPFRLWDGEAFVLRLRPAG